jgi:hypothetical protein
MQFVLKEVLVSNEILGGSRVALEEAFFARENEKLRQQLRDLDEPAIRPRPCTPRTASFSGRRAA